MAEYNLIGIPKTSGTGEEEKPAYKLDGISKASTEFNFNGIPNEDGDISLIPQIGEGHGKTMRPATKEEDQQDFDFAVSRFADQLAEASTGKTPEQLLKGQRELSGVMTRFPQVGIALTAPYLAAGFEALQQVKNAVVAAKKQEKYNPLEARFITELLPNDLPTPVKFAASVGEALTDVALIGGAANLAKQGLLDDTIKTIGKKLEDAGYGTGKVTINRETLKEYAKGTTLETEASNWLKAQALNVPAKDKIAAAGKVMPEDFPAPSPISLPPWSKAFGQNSEQAARNIQAVIKIAGTDEAKLVSGIKDGIIRGSIVDNTGALGLSVPSAEKIISDLSESGFHLPGKNNFDYKTHLKEVELNAEPAPERLMNELSPYFNNERGSVTLPDMPIKQNIEGFKARLGQEFIRFYGITPEGRQAFTKLRESQEVREMDVIDFLKGNVSLSKQDAKLMTYHLENPGKYPIPDNLKNQASIIDGTFQEVFKELDKRGMMHEKFPDSFINKANKDIEEEQEAIKSLKDEKAIGYRLKKIAELKHRVDYLKTLSYVPHRYRPLIESQAVNLFREGKFSQKLSATVSKLKGRKIATLDEAKELGLIPEDDVRILLGSYMEYANRKIAIHDFIESIKPNKNIIMTDKEAPEDWKKVLLSQLDGYRVHPLMVRALEDYAMNPGNKGLLWEGYDNVNRVLKTILFYNPFIMTINNLQQTYLAGGINTNLPKYLWESVHDMTQKTDFYKDAIQAGLFSSPYNVRPAISDQIKLWIDTSNEKYPKLKRTLETAVNPVAMYKEIGNATWNMDRVLRMSTVKYYLAKGMKFQDAVDKTNLFYVDYAFIPDHLRIGLNRVFLTPTYRSGVARLYYNLIRHPIKNKSAVGRLIGLWIATGLFAAWAGYKLENGYRLVKKLKEPIVTPEGKLLEEKVFALPSPLFEYQKIFGRAFARTLYLNLARVPYIGASIAENKDWKGEQITDRALPLDDRARQIIHYIIKTAIAPIEGFENLTGSEQTAIEKVLNMLSIAVYKRQGSTKYLINQTERTISDHKDYLRRHPKATDNQRREVQLETQKRIDLILKKIGEHERSN